MAKGAIDGVVGWKRARSFFYWRLRRRLAECALRKQVAKVIAEVEMNSSDESSMDTASWRLSRETCKQRASELLKDWYLEDVSSSASSAGAGAGGDAGAWRFYAGGSSASGNAVTSDAQDDRLWSDDRRVLSWMKTPETARNIERRVREIRFEAISRKVIKFGEEDSDAVVNGVLEMIESLPEAKREKVVGALRRGVIFVKPQASSSEERTVFRRGRDRGGSTGTF